MMMMITILLRGHVLYHLTWNRCSTLINGVSDHKNGFREIPHLDYLATPAIRAVP